MEIYLVGDYEAFYPAHDYLHLDSFMNLRLLVLPGISSLQWLFWYLYWSHQIEWRDTNTVQAHQDNMKHDSICLTYRADVLRSKYKHKMLKNTQINGLNYALQMRRCPPECNMT